MSQQPEKTREDSFRVARKQIVRSAFLALAALGVIVFACYAWFVSSGTVTGKISSVLMNGTTFELASVGGSGAHDEMITSLRSDENIGEGDPWPDAPTQSAAETGTITGSNRDILWKLTDSSNLNNQAGENKDTGIQPGSSNTLQFYVVPKCNGNLKLNCNVGLIPIAQNEDGNTFHQIEIGNEGGSNWYINRFLRSHFLFTYSYQYTSAYDSSYNDKNQNSLSLVNYSDGSFTLDLSGVQEDKPILVTLHWIWPRLLRDIIGNDLLGDHNLSAQVMDWMKQNPNDFFYNSGNTVNSPNFSSAENTQVYNNYYNYADDHIGTNVYGVIVQLTAEAV